MVGYGRDRKKSSCSVERGTSEEVNSEEWTEVGSQLLTMAKLGVRWSVAAARFHVWVHGPAAALICVDVHSS